MGASTVEPVRMLLPLLQLPGYVPAPMCVPALASHALIHLCTCPRLPAAVLVGGRHHCRSCGGTVCQRHSSDAEGLTLTVRLPGGGNSERVCDQCFEKWETQNRVEQGLGERGGASHAAVVSPFAADLAAMEAADKRASSPEAPAEASVSAGAGATAGAGAEAAPGDDGAGGVPADAAVTAAGDKPTVAQPVTSSTKQRVEPPLVKLPPDDAVLSLQVRPPARECRMLKNKKDERVVFKLCQGAMLYADLMKDKLADHVRWTASVGGSFVTVRSLTLAACVQIPKVLQFMLLERSRESIFNGLSKQLRRSDVHRQFVKHMTPHLMDIQSQVGPRCSCFSVRRRVLTHALLRNACPGGQAIGAARELRCHGAHPVWEKHCERHVYW